MNLLDIVRSKLCTWSNEDVLNKTMKEVEITIYAKVKNLDHILNMGNESMRLEQWEIPVDSETGRLRIRSIDNSRFLLTSKTYSSGTIGALEHTTLINKEQFENIRKMCDDGYFKTRVIIPMRSSDLRWEVDLHYTNGGAKFSDWVKIDLEKVSTLSDVPEDIPFECTEIIVDLPSSEHDLSAEETRTVEWLWSEEWSKIMK